MIKETDHIAYVRMEDELFQRIEKVAKKERRTVVRQIAMMLERQLEIEEKADVKH